MTVNAEKLLKMAEQITANLAYTDDEAVVAEQVANHLRRFWDPRMLAAFSTHAAAHPDQLSPALRTAAQLLAS